MKKYILVQVMKERQDFMEEVVYQKMIFVLRLMDVWMN